MDNNTSQSGKFFAGNGLRLSEQALISNRMAARLLKPVIRQNSVPMGAELTSKGAFISILSQFFLVLPNTSLELVYENVPSNIGRPSQSASPQFETQGIPY